MRRLLVVAFAVVLCMVAEAETAGWRVPLQHTRTKAGVLFQSVTDVFTGQFQVGDAQIAVRLTGTQEGGGLLDGVTGGNSEAPSTFKVDSFLLFADSEKEADATPMPSHICFANRLYVASLDAETKTLVLAPAEEPLSTVRIPMGVDRLLMASVKDGKLVLFHRVAAGEIKLLPGEYRMVSYVLRRKDDAGALWQTKGSWGRNDASIKVEEKGESILSFGEPFIPRAMVNQSSIAKLSKGASSSLRMDFALFGQGGERISLPSVVSGRSGNNTPPTYKVLLDNGNQVASGRFEYGWGGTCSATWSGAKKDTSYILVCEYQAKPFNFVADKQPLRF